MTGSTENDDYTFRRARSEDIVAIVTLLADDPLGATREDLSMPLNQKYQAAFDAIDNDPHQFLMVAQARDGSVAGTLQVSILTSLSRLGARRGQIEAVRVRKLHRGAGLGRKMFEWAVDYCRAQACVLVQLTSDKERTGAHRFYDSLGFSGSHTGYKLNLEQ